MINFKTWLEEKKKTKESLPPTATSSPVRGANQDQSGYNGKNDTADYTISDETGPDSWEKNSEAKRIATVKKIIKQDERFYAVAMPHSKIKEEAIDEVIAGVGGTRISPVNMGQSISKKRSIGSPSNTYKMQLAADKRVRQLDQAAQQERDRLERERQMKQKERERDSLKRQREAEQIGRAHV